jgi:hypothetical protein
VRRDVLLPLLLLLGYASAFGVAALGSSSVIAFDDHPGQLYRLWHVLRYGFAPWAWNPGWWAGYPELQFYPPGFAYLGALLHAGSFGMLTASTAYHALAWAAYVAPGVTVFALLTRLLGQGWSALVGAFVALTLSAGVASGVEGGVHWGMVAARLAWALLPLLILALSSWVDNDRPFPLLGVVLIAFIVITHPAHLPTAVVILLLAAAARPENRRARLRTALLALGLAAMLTAFWTLPLLARLEHARALAWGTLPTGPTMALARPLPLVLIGLAVIALGPSVGPFPGTAALVARLPWLMILVVAADLYLAEPLGVRWLPPDRVADGGWMALLLASGYGAGSYFLGAPRWRPEPPDAPRSFDKLFAALRRVPLPLGSVAGVVVVILMSLPGHTLTLWPQPTVWPTLEAVERGFRLPALWAALRSAPEGHVLFTRSGLPLVHGTDWHRPHTHATALAPLGAGRRIIHGTFTHPSPIAALVYRGDAGRGAITQLTEQLDGHSLFGRRLADLDPGTFNGIATRLGISTVVVFDEDVLTRQAMDANPEFAAWRTTPPFILYTRRQPCPLPTEVAAGDWRITLDGAPGAWVSAHIAYYPLWRAAQEGRPLPVRRGSLGELEIRLAQASRPVELIYRPAAVEWTGLGISGAAALLWLALLITRGRVIHPKRADRS